MVVGPTGVGYVNTWSGAYYGHGVPHASRFLVALEDTTGAGKANVIERFGETVETGGASGTGIGMYRGSVYAEINDRIVRYALPAGSIVPHDAPETIVSRLPLDGDHPMHPFIVDAGGTIHGCWDRAPYPQGGYNIVFPGHFLPCIVKDDLFSNCLSEGLSPAVVFRTGQYTGAGANRRSFRVARRRLIDHRLLDLRRSSIPQAGHRGVDPHPPPHPLNNLENLAESVLQYTPLRYVLGRFEAVQGSLARAECGLLANVQVHVNRAGSAESLGLGLCGFFDVRVNAH